MSKNKEIKVLPGYKEWGMRESDCICEVFIGRDVYDQIKAKQNEAYVTLTFEIPIEEPEAKITPSMIDEAYEEWLSECGVNRNHVSFSYFLKSKLFQNWEDT